ncbi:MAG TPA: ferritin-like domain-containing protein, partial [Gaiella sp.]|nr:ferritin-like domain-containing protein [Gaiella sp.]
MTRPLSRRRLLTVAAGGAALAALPVRPASAATDEELAYANFAVSSELLLADLYQRALAAKVVAGPGQVELRAGRRAAIQHAGALSGLLTGAGQEAPTTQDFDFRWPEKAFDSAGAIAGTARVVLRALLGAYQTAIVTVSEPSYRILYTSLAASAGQQVGVLSALAAKVVAGPGQVELRAGRRAAIQH